MGAAGCVTTTWVSWRPVVAQSIVGLTPESNGRCPVLPVVRLGFKLPNGKTRCACCPSY